MAPLHTVWPRSARETTIVRGPTDNIVQFSLLPSHLALLRTRGNPAHKNLHRLQRIPHTGYSNIPETQGSLTLPLCCHNQARSELNQSINRIETQIVSGSHVSAECGL